MTDIGDFDYSALLLDGRMQSSVAAAAFTREYKSGPYATIRCMVAGVREVMTMRRWRFVSSIRLASDSTKAFDRCVAAGWRSRESTASNEVALRREFEDDAVRGLEELCAVEADVLGDSCARYDIKIEHRGRHHVQCLASSTGLSRDGVGTAVAFVPCEPLIQVERAERCRLIDLVYQAFDEHMGAEYGLIDVCDEYDAGSGLVHMDDRWVTPIGWSRYCDQLSWRESIRSGGRLRPLRAYWGNYFGAASNVIENRPKMSQEFEAICESLQLRDRGSVRVGKCGGMCMSLSSDVLHALPEVCTGFPGFRRTVPWLEGWLRRVSVRKEGQAGGSG